MLEVAKVHSMPLVALILTSFYAKLLKATALGARKKKISAFGAYLALAAHLIALTETLFLGVAQEVPGHNVIAQRHVHLPAGVGLACEKDSGQAKQNQQGVVFGGAEGGGGFARLSSAERAAAISFHRRTLLAAAGQMSHPTSKSNIRAETV